MQNKFNALRSLIFIYFLIFAVVFSYAELPLMQAPVQNITSDSKDITTATEEPEQSLDFQDPFTPAFPSTKEAASDESANKAQSIPEVSLNEVQFDVTGIVWGTDKPRAIINDSVFGIGDIVNEVKILNIDSEGIHVQYKNKEFLKKRDMIDKVKNDRDDGEGK